MKVEFVYKLLRDALTTRTLAEAVASLSEEIPQDLVEQAEQMYRQSVQQISILRDPPSMDEPFDPWYPGPASEGCWSALSSYWRDQKGWSQQVINNVDEASTRIVARLAQPTQRQFAKRGLVLGFVQSGKTANFTAVISKAVDAGYKLVIVLAGLHDGLRTQTQRRLDHELIELRPQHWHALTTAQSDFTVQGNALAFLSSNNQQHVLCVIKKNAVRLNALRRWLLRAKDLLVSCPTLIIDDEADQASVDTKGTDDPSKINKLILDILKVLPRSVYLAYTATPFANILSDTRHVSLLYPRDFIVDLPRPDGYFGPERIFGVMPESHDEPVYDTGLDMVREVPEDETALLQPASPKDRAGFIPGMTPSLRAALRWFWLACAARRARGQADRHMSMLIHTTVYTDVHDRFKPLIEAERDRVLASLSDPALLDSLQAYWESENVRLPPQAVAERPLTFDELRPHLADALSASQVVIDNGTSVSRLVYPDDRGTTQIVVGGNTLSRGLTLEGLTVSFYIRTSGTYDTLLQMGRWFGYRQGYADVARIWMTTALQESFQHLARVELELREQIGRYELDGLTPTQFAPAIRTHSSLAITSPLKMRYAVDAEISYSDDTRQTTYFSHLDPAWLGQNLDGARRLVTECNRLVRPEQVWGAHTLWRNIDVNAVLDFLDRYTIHATHAEMKRELLVGYIRKQLEDRALLSWNVAVVGMSKDSPRFKTRDGLLPTPEPTVLLSRAKMRTSAPEVANLKAIMSMTDRVIDFALPTRPNPSRTVDGLPFSKWAAARRGDRAQGVDSATGRLTPLLLLYPIDRASAPITGGEGGTRAPLDAVEDLIGLGLIFPKASRFTPISYKTADLSRQESDAEILEWTGEVP